MKNKKEDYTWIQRLSCWPIFMMMGIYGAVWAVEYFQGQMDSFMVKSGW